MADRHGGHDEEPSRQSMSVNDARQPLEPSHAENRASKELLLKAREHASNATAQMDEEEGEDVDDYLRKIYLARKMKSSGQSSQGPVKNNHTRDKIDAVVEPVQKVRIASEDLTVTASFASGVVPESLVKSSPMMEKLCTPKKEAALSTKLGPVGRICREARNRRSPSPEPVTSTGPNPFKPSLYSAFFISLINFKPLHFCETKAR